MTAILACFETVPNILLCSLSDLKGNMTLNNTIAHQRLVLSGDRERFKELLRRRLIECGWRDQVRVLCREAVKENESGNVTFDTLVTKVTPKARALVPDTVKKELLQKIKSHLLTQKEN